MFSKRPGVGPSSGGPRWGRPPPPPPPVSAPATGPLSGLVRFGSAAARRATAHGPPTPQHLRSRPAAAPGCPAARSEPAPQPARAWPTSSSTRRRRHRPTTPRPQSRASSRSRPRAVAPHWWVPSASSHTPCPHWSTRLGAQTGGSTLPFPIGWWRRPPSALDSCRPLIEPGRPAGSGRGGGGSGSGRHLG